MQRAGLLNIYQTPEKHFSLTKQIPAWWDMFGNNGLTIIFFVLGIYVTHLVEKIKQLFRKNTEDTVTIIATPVKPNSFENNARTTQGEGMVLRIVEKKSRHGIRGLGK